MKGRRWQTVWSLVVWHSGVVATRSSLRSRHHSSLQTDESASLCQQTATAFTFEIQFWCSQCMNPSARYVYLLIYLFFLKHVQAVAASGVSYCWGLGPGLVSGGFPQRLCCALHHFKIKLHSTDSALEWSRGGAMICASCVPWHHRSSPFKNPKICLTGISAN